MTKKDSNIRKFNWYLNNPYARAALEKGGNRISTELLSDILEYEHGKHLANCFEKEFRIIELNGLVEKYQLEHTKSLSLMFETELQKSQLEEYNRKLAITDQEKNLFIANMSHEIRTPMNAILGMISLLLETKLDTEQEDFIRTIKFSSESLLTIINDILDFSKIDAGKLDIEETDFDLWLAIDSAFELLAPKIRQKGLTFSMEVDEDIPVFVKGDAVRLHQMLLNLINNAYKFTQKGSITLSVSLDSQNKEKAYVRFMVKDTGIGIAEDKKDKIFHLFYQVDPSATRNYGGTGLGLAITKKLAELMGGEVGFDSVEGKGTNFWFTVLYKKQDQESCWASLRNKKIKRRKILIVSEDKEKFHRFMTFLKQYNLVYEILFSSHNLINVLKTAFLENDPFEIVIIDEKMTDVEEENILEALKRDADLKNTLLSFSVMKPDKKKGSVTKRADGRIYFANSLSQIMLFHCVNLFYSKRMANLANTSEFDAYRAMNSEQNQNVRILLVDDNAVNQKLVKHLLRKVGYEIDTANNGKEAIQILRKETYNLILMDIQMPMVDGLEATRIIRDQNSDILDHKVPIIGLTAKAMKGDREICLEAGMNGYLTKPIVLKQFFETIRMLLR